MTEDQYPSKWYAVGTVTLSVDLRLPAVSGPEIDPIEPTTDHWKGEVREAADEGVLWQYADIEDIDIEEVGLLDSEGAEIE
jgi:hypothetical protein